MKRAATWSIDGIKPDIREAAREAARRQGMSLSEWLNDIIAEQASDLDIDVDEMNSDDRLEAVAARLNQLGGKGRHERPTRSRAARDRDDDDYAPRFARDSVFRSDELEERRRMKRQQRSYEPSYERSYDRPRDHFRVQDAEALLDAAIDAFEERAAKSQRHTAQSVDAVTRLIKNNARQRDESLEMLSDISDRLTDIETQMTRHAVDEACVQEDRNNNLDALPTVAKRLADIESHLAKRSQDDGFRPIKGALTRLEARLDSFNQKTVPPARDETDLRRLENKLDALLRNSALISPEPSIRRPSAKADWRESLESAVSEIGQQQRFLNGEGSDWRAAPRQGDGPLINARINRGGAAFRAASRGVDVHPLQSDIAALGVKLEAMRLQDLAKDLTRLRSDVGTMSAGLADLAPREAVTSIESAIHNLTTRIEASREEGMRETLLKPLTEIADDLRHSLGAITPQSAIDSLQREIKAISEKLETRGASSHEPSVLARLQEQTQEIHHLLTAAAAHPVSIDQIEKKVAALADQVERQQSFPHPGLGPSEDDYVSQRLQQTQVDSLVKIEDRLSELSQKFESAIATTPSVTSSKMDSESLEAVISALSDKFVTAQDPNAGHGAIEALQSQIAELAQRLERSDSGFSALSSLQNSVGELFTHLDKTRIAANDAAETSAREAAREAVREVLEQTGQIANSLPRDSEITREIADLRLVQDESARQTHSTLNAVHETLEKIVDRLAMLEEEIGDAQETSAASFRLAEQSANYREKAAVAQSKPQAPAQKKREPRIDSEMPRSKSRSADSTEFLIEPGTLFPKGKEAPIAKEPVLSAGDKTTESEPSRSRADFIAAARRAAQAAQADQSQREMTRPRIPMVEDDEKGPSVSLIAQTRDFLSHHKRQLTLSIAALFLAVGAYAVVKTMTHTNVDMSSNVPNAAVHSMLDTRNKADTRIAAPLSVAPTPSPQAMQDKAAPKGQDPDAKPDGPSARSDNAVPNLPVMASGGISAAQKPIAGSDPIVTGSIVTPKAAAAPAAESQAALAALREQADAGNANAQYELATRYAEGRSMARDFKLAAEWYEKAAARGLAPAAYRLGSLYEKGLGVTRDFTRAKALYQKAAEQGHSHAMHNLAVLIAEGGDGKPDYAAAAIWFRKAAEFGIRDSQYNLAILYARGLGVQQDLIQSYTWFAIAAAQGDEDAAKKREDVALRLDAKSLTIAKAAVDVFHPREADRASNEVQIPPGGWEATAPSQVMPKASVRPKLSRL